MGVTGAQHPPGTVECMSALPVIASTRLLVVRHGQTEWNAGGRWQGHADVPLDEAGMRQAASAAQHLGTFGGVWSSDLRRAQLTAQIIAEILGIGPVSIDHRLRETEVGPWEGLTREEVDAGWPGFLAARRRPDGFESYALAAERMANALIDIAAAHRGEEVLVVSHAGITRALRRMLGVGDDHLPNLAGSWFTVDERGELTVGDVVPLLWPAEPTEAAAHGQR